MNRPSRFAPPFRLGEWTVLPALNRVSGPGGDVRLEPRVMAVLVRLAAEPGQVVGRLDLLDGIWGDAVVGEEILTRAISELRRVFGDRARDPRYIETIINNGYRLIAPVELLPDADPAPTAPEPAPAPPPPPGSHPEPTADAAMPAPTPPLLRRVLASVALVVVALALVVVAARWFPGRRAGEPAALPPAAARAVPLTAFPGHERQPALTADGRRVAFAWSGPAGDAEGIWIKQSNSESPLRLSGGPGVAAWPAWSPDEQTVAWVQLRGGESEIRTVPSIGGPERVLLTVPGTVVGLDWATDGELIFSARDTTTGLHRLLQLSPATLAVAGLADGAAQGAGEVQPRCSPDGSRLAWIALAADGTSSLWVADREGRGRVELLAERTGLAGLAWTRDSAGLVVGIDHGGTYGLWEVARDGGPRRLTESAEFAWNPAVARGTGEIVYEQVRVDQDLWRIRILGREPWRLESSRFLASTRWEYEAEYSPDGAHIAVVSARSGSPELWVCGADGDGLQRLTDTGGGAVARPRWSPDGAQIAFEVRDRDRTRVATVPAGGGPARDVTPSDQDWGLVAWAPDIVGAVYARELVSSRRVEVYDTATGTFDPSYNPRPGLQAAAAERAGRRSYMTVAGIRGIVTPRRGIIVPGEEFTPVVPGLSPVDHDNWRLAGDEIFWVMRAAGEVFLMIHDLDSGRDAIVTDLPGFGGTGLAVAPDGSAVIYPRLGPAEGDLMRLVNP